MLDFAMHIDSHILKRASYILAVLSGIVAFTLSFQNSERAASGCGEYGSAFDYAVAIKSALLLCIPSIVLTFMIRTTWNRGSYKFASISVTFIYLGLVLHALIHSAISNYSPCDRKGDEQSAAIFVMGAFGIPLLWGALMICAETAKVGIAIFIRLRNRK